MSRVYTVRPSDDGNGILIEFDLCRVILDLDQSAYLKNRIDQVFTEIQSPVAAKLRGNANTPKK